MRILYLSCHIVLEYDELRLLGDLGYDVFSAGGYPDPLKPHIDTRPALPNLKFKSNPDILNEYYHMCHQNMLNGLSNKHFTKRFLDNFDCVIVMHNIEWIKLNWELFKDKILILRTIGQNIKLNEDLLIEYMKKGVKVVRYSPKERDLYNYAGESAVIRFLKYKSDFLPRNYNKKYIISFGQSLNQRRDNCHTHVIEDIADRLPLKLFGPHNENFIFSSGQLTYEQQIKELSINAAYLNTGTFPALYTLGFMEALLAGIPVVSIGHKTAKFEEMHYPIEVPEILDSVYGYYYDDINDMQDIFIKLLEDDDLNKKVSDRQILIATDLFSVEKNMYKWKEFLNSL